MKIPTQTASKIIITINSKNNYSGAIQRITGITAAAVIKIINNFKKEKILTLTKSGRKNIIQLTKKGERLKFLIEEINEL